MICARTDAAAGSLADAIARGKRYAEAGADVVFVEALASRDDIKRVRDQIRAPLLANMTEFGRTPALSLAEWREAGYELVIFPVSAFRVAARAIETFYGDLRQKGHAQDMLPAMMTRTALYELIGRIICAELGQARVRWGEGARTLSLNGRRSDGRACRRGQCVHAQDGRVRLLADL